MPSSSYKKLFNKFLTRLVKRFRNFGKWLATFFSRNKPQGTSPAVSQPLEKTKTDPQSIAPSRAKVVLTDEELKYQGLLDTLNSLVKKHKAEYQKLSLSDDVLKEYRAQIAEAQTVYPSAMSEYVSTLKREHYSLNYAFNERSLWPYYAPPQTLGQELKKIQDQVVSVEQTELQTLKCSVPIEKPYVFSRDLNALTQKAFSLMDRVKEGVGAKILLKDYDKMTILVRKLGCKLKYTYGGQEYANREKINDYKDFVQRHEKDIDRQIKDLELLVDKFLPKLEKNLATETLAEKTASSELECSASLIKQSTSQNPVKKIVSNLGDPPKTAEMQGGQMETSPQVLATKQPDSIIHSIQKKSSGQHPYDDSKSEVLKTDEEHAADLKALILFLNKEGFAKEIEDIQKSDTKILEQKWACLELYHAKKPFLSQLDSLQYTLNIQKNDLFSAEQLAKDANDSLLLFFKREERNNLVTEYTDSIAAMQKLYDSMSKDASAAPPPSRRQYINMAQEIESFLKSDEPKQAKRKAKL